MLVKPAGSPYLWTQIQTKTKLLWEAQSGPVFVDIVILKIFVKLKIKLFTLSATTNYIITLTVIIEIKLALNNSCIKKLSNN